MKFPTSLASLLLCLAMAVASSAETPPPGRAPHSANPILPGYFADPSIVEHEGEYYLYATLDPWGDETLGCWVSSDLKSWSYRFLSWPTKKACTSPTSMDAKVWAPSVIRGPGGKFHMAVSVGSEVWLGVADHPLGPWRNVKGDRPFIAADWNRDFHMIDAELFLDDDGQPYLYWGSGWNWVNGHCFAVKLTKDLSGMVGEPRDVTPTNYFEAPFMVKRHGLYFLMYSSGNTTKDTYQVHYAVGKSPLGPFREPAGNPILQSNPGEGIVSPGHHAVFSYSGRDYILYHRHSVPFDPNTVGRQVCVDEITFTKEGLIEPVKPTHTAPEAWRRPTPDEALTTGAIVTSSSQASELTAPAFAWDDNYATRWAASPDGNGGWIQVDFGTVKTIQRQRIRPEFAWKSYRFDVQASDDGQQWKSVADFSQGPFQGSPIVVEYPVIARYLRLKFSDETPSKDIAIIDWACW